MWGGYESSVTASATVTTAQCDSASFPEPRYVIALTKLEQPMVRIAASGTNAIALSADGFFLLTLVFYILSILLHALFI